MLVSIAVMAYAARKRQVAELLAALDAAGYPDVPVAWDPKGRRPRSESVWPVRRLALEARDPAARFHLVLQDDAEIGRDFRARLERVLTAGGEDRAYHLFYRTKNRQMYLKMELAAREAIANGQGYLDWPKLTGGLAVVLPCHIIPALIDACEQMTEYQSDDIRMRHYLRSIRMPVRHVFPSLVNQRAELSGRNGPNRGRRAKWFE